MDITSSVAWGPLLACSLISLFPSSSCFLGTTLFCARHCYIRPERLGKRERNENNQADIIGCGIGNSICGIFLHRCCPCLLCLDTSKDGWAFGAMFNCRRWLYGCIGNVEAVEDVDLVVVSTNDNSHFAIAKEVLKRSMLLVEKPMSPMLGVCRAGLLADRTGSP